MIPSASWLGEPETTLLILLFTGHVVGDFLLQTRAMVERKGEPPVLLRHAGMILMSHLVTLLPFLPGELRSLGAAFLLLLLLGTLHALVDLGKLRWQKRTGGSSVTLFLVDQATHGMVILAIWRIWRAWLGAEPGLMAPANPALLAAAALLLTAYVLNGNAAAALIKLFLDRFPVAKEAGEASPGTDVQRMGKTIGILERMLVFSLVLMGQWEAIGWFFAGKTVARFRELDNRAFSEYYLIGTLSSLLFAAATGLGVRLALRGSF